MRPTDRQVFEAVFGKLCSAFNVPVGDRVNAYWSAFAKMELDRFSECVDFALGEEGAEKLPTVPGIWAIHRKLKARAQAPQLPAQQRDPRDDQHGDNLQLLANRLLLQHVISRGGLGSQGRYVAPKGVVDCQPSEELLACRRFSNALVQEFAEYVREGDDLATPAEFLRRFAVGLLKISPLHETTRVAWRSWLKLPAAQVPFARSMADIPIAGELVL